MLWDLSNEMASVLVIIVLIQYVATIIANIMMVRGKRVRSVRQAAFHPYEGSEGSRRHQ